MKIKYSKYGVLAFIIVAFQILYVLPATSLALAKLLIISIVFYFFWVESFLKTNYRVFSNQISILFLFYLIILFFSSIINIGSLDYSIEEFLIGVSILLIPTGFFYGIAQDYQLKKDWSILINLQKGIVSGAFVVLVFVAFTGYFEDYFGVGKRFMSQGLSPSMLALNANLLLAYSLLKVMEKRKAIYIATILFSLILIILSLSKSGIILAVLTFVYVAIIKKAYLMTAIVLSIMIGAMFIFLPFEMIFEVLQEYSSSDTDTLETLSGRSDIWEVCQELIDKKPLLGYGYNSPFKLLPVFYTRFHITQAHSAYYESMLSVGIIGTALIGVYILKVVVKCVRYFALIKNNIVFSWFFFVIIIGIVRGSTEASFVQANNIIDVFIFYLSLFILDLYISLTNKSDSLTVEI